MQPFDSLTDLLMNWDVPAIRQDFPILQRQVNNNPLVYLDNAATVQKPRQMLQAIDHYYRNHNANVHRGVHSLSAQATERFESARDQVAKFINAKSSKEIIFTRGTTESINLVAQSFGRTFFQAEDEVMISAMEHHSNIVPWQLLREQIGIKLQVIPMDDAGNLDLVAFEQLFTDRTRLVALNHVSNSLGTVNPVKQMISTAHSHGVPVLLDSAQAVAHSPIDVVDLDCDFMAFSGHKLYGPTGIGVLYGKEELLNDMPPYQGGGEMIESVSFEQTTFAKLPHKFEAGTPNIAGAIGLGAAINYVTNLGLTAIHAYEQELLTYALQGLNEITGIRILGQAEQRAPIISFVLDQTHALDLATLVDQMGIAIRSGHHCTMPAMHRLGVNATARVSMACYNTFEEIDNFINAVVKARAILVDA